MKTPFDFVSMVVFALIATIYLHRSAQTAPDRTPLWVYLLAAAGCATGDVIANHGRPIFGGAILSGALAGAVWIALKGASLSDR